ncbi:ATP synthase subunit a [Phycisphaerae bacterium RAS2]|nr:ATP synthase subunit a [Phycisphaerae bacterium RAS2]
MMNYLLASGDNPLSHVVDHTWLKTADGKYTILSNHVIMMLAAAVLLVLFMPLWSRSRSTGNEVADMTPRGPRNMIEAICAFLRDKVARPNLGEHTDRFIVYIWTAFFFVLTCNILGLLPLQPVTQWALGKPIYGTATGNIWVTGTLATCTLFMIVINGLRIHGMTYVKHFFMGPFPINCLIAVLEVIGLIVKAVALAIRLFANMCAGHILLAVLLSFIMMAGKSSQGMGFAIAVPVVLGSVAINMLEIFVAFLQAFIFTFLSCVFIGLAVNIHHDHEHDEHHEAGHGAHAGPAH